MKLKTTPGAATTLQPARRVKWGFAGAFALLAASFVLLGLFYLGRQREHFRRSVQDQLTAIADLKVRQIVEWRDERLGDARAIMRDPFLGQEVERLLAERSGSESRGPLLTWLDYTRVDNQSVRVLLLDPQLKVRLTSPADQTYFGPVGAAFAAEAIRSNLVVISDLHRSRGTGYIHFDIAVPLHSSFAGSQTGAAKSGSSGGQPIGVLDLEVDPEQFLYPLIQSWPTPSRTAETLLVRREGDTILYLNELRHRRGTALALRLPLTLTNSTAVLAVLGREGNVEGIDYRGEPVLAVSRRVPETSWFLVAKVDQEEIFAPWRARSRLVLLTIACLISLTGLALWALWRRREAGWLKAELAERKWTEEQLRKLSHAMEQSPVSIVITDLQGRIEYVNPKFCALTGYTLDEVRGQNPRVLKSGETPPATYRQLWETILAGREWRGEFHNKKKTGELYWESASLSPVVDETGRITHFLAAKEDITERKRVEEALRNSEIKYRTLFESSVDGILIADLETKVFKYANPTVCRMLGYAAEELRTVGVSDIHPKDALPHVVAEFEAMARGEKALATDLPCLRKDGTLVYANVNATKVTIDGRQCLVGFFRDITERKRAEEALRASQQLIEGILNAMPVRVFWKDKNLVYLGCNAVLARDAGFAEPKDLIGKDDFQMGWREQAELYRADDRQVIESGCSKLLIEEPQTTPAGENITLLSSKLPLRGSKGEISGVLGTYMDITERKRLETQLFQSQKLETVGKLAGGIAHEFNSILTAIIGQSELLLGDLPAGSPLAQNATEISQAAGRAATLTRQLLAYGRKQFLQPETLDLNRVITSMEGMFHLLMDGEVDTQIVAAPGLQAVKVDAGQIEQVIVNMAINARDAMPNGGKLTLETANVTLDQEQVSRFPELKAGEYVMLAITDTGAGMSEEVKARVFEPFFTTKSVGQGTGLGLSTCYGIIKQSGGHINVDSEPGRGTTFKIYLPQVEPQAKIPLQRLDSPDLPRGTETILLVEDDPALREMAATLLRRLGYTVLAAANGNEALSLKQQCDNGHIDLLFTDVVMPQMSGKELSERVRALYPHTRILFTSANTGNAIVHQGALNQGVTLLQKPFTPSALAHKLREVLDQPGAPKPDPAQKTSGFTKISDDVKTPGS